MDFKRGLVVKFLIVSLTVFLKINEASVLDNIQTLIQKQKGFAAQDFLLNYFTQESYLNSVNQNVNRTELGRALYLYGKLNYLDLSLQGQNSLQIAYYFFRLSSSYGNVNATRMCGLFDYFFFNSGFNLFWHLENQTHTINLEDHTIQQLYAYSQTQRFSSSVLNFYFSNLQSDLESTLALGHRYSVGFLGTAVNCSTASLYYKQVNDQMYMKSSVPMRSVEIRRLDKEILNKNVFDGSKIDQQHLDNEADILITSPHLEQSDWERLKIISRYYYNGMKGYQKNYNKTYEITEKLVYEANSNQRMIDSKQRANIIAFLAKLLYEGHGCKRVSQKMQQSQFQLQFLLLPYNKNIKRALSLFNEASLFNNSMAYNYLGISMMEGNNGQKNLSLVLTYFKKAYQMGDRDAAFNLGSLLFMPSSTELIRNPKLGYEILYKNSLEGHAPSSYAIALLMLDGVDIYYSCQLAVQLMVASSQFGPWGDYINKGNDNYSKNNYRRAFAYYLQSANLGQPSSKLNAAILADHYKILRNEDYDYINIQTSLGIDPVYKILIKSEQVKLKRPFLFLFDDYFQILKDQQPQEQMRLFFKYLEIPKHIVFNLNHAIAYRLFLTSVKDFAYSSLQMGDYYYFGTYNFIDFQDAYYYYKRASEMEDNTPIAAQANYNLAKMLEKGIGVAQNISLANFYYNKSLNYMSQSSFIGQDILQIIFDMKQAISKVDLQNFSIQEEFTSLSNKFGQFINKPNKFIRTTFHSFVIFILLFTLVTCIGIQQRKENSFQIYHDDSK